MTGISCLPDMTIDDLISDQLLAKRDAVGVGENVRLAVMLYFARRSASVLCTRCVELVQAGQNSCALHTVSSSIFALLLMVRQVTRYL